MSNILQSALAKATPYSDGGTSGLIGCYTNKEIFALLNSGVKQIRNENPTEPCWRFPSWWARVNERKVFVSWVCESEVEKMIEVNPTCRKWFYFSK